MESASVEAERSGVGTGRVLVFVNPKSGSCESDEVRDGLALILGEGGRRVVFREPNSDVSVIRREIDRVANEGPIDLIVAAGGDGTVSSVANALVGRDIPIGVVPLGTANVLARDLGIPVELDAAARLLVGPNRVRTIDALVVDGHHYFTQFGVGIDSIMIRDTKDKNKRRFGRWAYLWTAAKALAGFQPRRFDLVIDGRQATHRASQIVVANTGMMGQPPFRWGPDIEPDDGRANLCVVRASSLVDYLSLFWNVVTSRHRKNPRVRYLTASERIEIRTRAPLPAQADGEIIGETPIEILVAARVLRVVTPLPE